MSRPTLPRVALLGAVLGTIFGNSSCRALLDPDADACRALNATEDTATMTVGATRGFAAVVYVEGTSPGQCVGSFGADFRWSSSAPSVATVDAATGLVTARAVGSAAIRARLGRPEREGLVGLRVVAAP